MVRPSGFFKSRNEKELRSLKAERSHAEIAKIVLVSRNTTDFAIVTLYPAT